MRSRLDQARIERGRLKATNRMGIAAGEGPCAVTVVLTGQQAHSPDTAPSHEGAAGHLTNLAKRVSRRREPSGGPRPLADESSGGEAAGGQPGAGRVAGPPVARRARGGGKGGRHDAPHHGTRRRQARASRVPLGAPPPGPILQVWAIATPLLPSTTNQLTTPLLRLPQVVVAHLIGGDIEGALDTMNDAHRNGERLLYETCVPRQQQL